MKWTAAECEAINRVADKLASGGLRGMGRRMRRYMRGLTAPRPRTQKNHWLRLAPARDRAMPRPGVDGHSYHPFPYLGVSGPIWGRVDAW